MVGRQRPGGWEKEEAGMNRKVKADEEGEGRGRACGRAGLPRLAQVVFDGRPWRPGVGLAVDGHRGGWRSHARSSWPFGKVWTGRVRAALWGMAMQRRVYSSSIGS